MPLPSATADGKVAESSSDMWEAGATHNHDNLLAMCDAPSTVYTLGHIFVVLRRSPAEIASPSPSPRRRAAGTHPPRRRLAGSRRRGRHRAERVLNAEVPYVRHSISWSANKFDYINRVNKRFHLRSMRVLRHTLPLVAMHLHG